MYSAEVDPILGAHDNIAGRYDRLLGSFRCPWPCESWVPTRSRLNGVDDCEKCVQVDEILNVGEYGRGER